MNFRRWCISIFWKIKYFIMKEEIIEVDLESRLKMYVPALFKLMGQQPFSWSQLNKRYSTFLQQRKIDFRLNGNYLKIEVNFFDVILQVMTTQQLEYENYFVYINKVFKNLSEVLSNEEKIMVNSILRNLLGQFNRKYIHSLGELFVLNNIMKSGKYRLKKIEYEGTKLGGNKQGKSIDFLFYSLDLKSEILLEVMNLELTEKNVSSDFEIERLLRSKIEGKIEDKKKSFPQKNFNIVPVLWGTSDDLRIVYDFYKRELGPKL